MIRSYVFRFFVVVFFIFIWNLNNASAQFNLTITQATTVEEVESWIDTVFLEGINPSQINNITFTGDPGSVGYFNGGYIFGFQVPQGIVMSSGFAGTLDKPNNCAAQNASGNTSGGSDPDLNALTSLAINDACVIEFDFKPAGDSVKFNFIFGSEEYHDYVNTTFNDVFGFFLSGPGISGPYTNNAINIAEVPGTHNPVSINNVNCGNVGPGCDIPLNDGPGCEYLVDNTQAALGRFQQVCLDAYTVPFVADNGVESCEWYHIKLAIGDAGDGAFDSGVFLEKGSFDPGNVEQETRFTHPTVDSLLYESCNGHESVLYFKIGSLRNDPYVLPFTVHGTAERDVDYQIITTYPGDTIYIPDGELVDSIRIRTFADGEIEGIEDIQIRFNPVMCGFGAPDTAIILLSDLPPMNDSNFVFTSICEQTVTLDFGNNIGGVAPYNFDWYTLGEETPTVDFNPSGDNYFQFPCVIKDTCGQQVSDTATVIIPELTANAGPDKSMCNQDSVQIEGSAPGAQNFLWESNPFDNSLVGKENQDTAWVYPNQNTEYYLTVSDNCTNNDKDTTYVSLDEAVADAGADQVICFSESATLAANGTDGYSWQWSANPPDPTLTGQETQQQIVVSPATTTVYSVTVTNDCGFSADDAAEVTVTPLPTADAGPDGAVCFGQEFQLNATGGTKYQWSSVPNDPSLYQNGQDTLPNPLVNPPTQEPYKYYVQVWTQCTNSDSMTLQVDPVPDLDLSADNDLLCYGDTVTISAIGNANYTWTADPADPTLSGQENNQSINVAPLETTTYTLVGVVAGFNCPATLTQTIEVKPELLSTFDIQASEICQGQTFTIMYTGNAATSASYNWDFDGAQIVNGSGSGPYDVRWDTEGLKTIRLSVEEDGCLAEPYEMNVEVLLTPVSAFDSDITEGCVPFTVEFANSTSNLGSDVTYLWNFGTGDESTDTSPSFTYTEPGLYTVSLTATNNGKCTDSYSLTDYIKANETPTADFIPVPPETVLEESTIDFTNSSSSDESLTYLWEFGDGETSTQQSPSHTYAAVGIYTVKLIVTTANGCENEIEKEVIVHPDFAVHAPTAFTPNNDGLNDVFDVKGVGIKEYLLQIYSRWGDLVYESKNLEDQWDGKFNGELVPAGTYVYTINYKSMLDRDYTKKGSVTVVK